MLPWTGTTGVHEGELQGRCVASKITSCKLSSAYHYSAIAKCMLLEILPSRDLALCYASHQLISLHRNLL